MLLPTFLLIAGVVPSTSMCTVGNPRNQKSGNDRIQVCMTGLFHGWSIDAYQFVVDILQDQLIFQSR